MTGVDERASDLLAEAEAALESVPTPGNASEDELHETFEDGLHETADDASDLLETTDADELLAALGLAELSDGSEPASIPEAIVHGERERVATLRALLTLAKLADSEDESERRQSLSTLQEAVDERTADEPRTETEDGAETDEGAVDDLEGEFRETVRSTLEKFGDDVRGFRDRLETVASDTDDGGDDDGGGDEASEEDDWIPSGADSSRNPTTYSTIAPPPSERPDVRSVTRHSTMPDRNRSSETEN
ncbi:hypothetical protein [Natrialbaceae archaeon AArc-T1-2]|uniref:hypothetical protein n=1 Tax=Natrialbaceae archaeon AArc-T1-2 TaxID=3053904 RepID=UPI00255A726D|nr:hypothetical protein [Natrialbaceae archaeon AArc-T1-2]WIV67075.1 hypothetical protein QQ977_15525 [Natrialbaceae archaeon AArc-T1-2]